jgi:dihydrofolate reductase
MVSPVILGSGRPLFPEDAADKTLLEPVDSNVFDSGVAVHTYRPTRDE